MKFLKGAFVFLIGAGVGTTISYMYYKKKLDEKYDEINELKEHYFGKIEQVKEKEKLNDILESNKYISNGKEVVTDMIDRVSQSSIMSSSPPEDTPDSPYIISERQFSETNLGYEKCELEYYLDDGALVDEDDELQVVDDIIGYDNLESFINDESINSMYIRNDKYGTDYLIHKSSGKYSEILGLGGDEDE